MNKFTVNSYLDRFGRWVSRGDFFNGHEKVLDYEISPDYAFYKRKEADCVFREHFIQKGFAEVENI